MFELFFCGLCTISLIIGWYVWDKHTNEVESSETIETTTQTPEISPDSPSVPPTKVETKKPEPKEPTYEELLRSILPGTKKKVQPKPTYEELLHKPEWYAKRNLILERDSHKCVFCGKTYGLHVHHRYYSQYPNHTKVAPWNYPDEALITLCEKCHKTLHQKQKIKVYYRKYNE